MNLDCIEKIDSPFQRKNDAKDTVKRLLAPLALSNKIDNINLINNVNG